MTMHLDPAARTVAHAAGIDLDAVRTRAEETFGSHALSRANQAVRRGPAVSRWDPPGTA